MLLVTGCTGHSGKYFLQELANNNFQNTIRCIVRKSSDTTFLDSTGLNIEKVVGDLCDQQFIDNEMNGIDTVLHISSIFYSINIMKAAIRNNVKKVIMVHTTGIYSKYKSASEEYKNIEATVTALAVENSIRIIYLRPTMIYGNITDLNMSKFIKMVDKLRIFPVINDGSALIQPVNARDLGKAYYQVLTSLNLSRSDYILSGEKPISLLEALKLISSNLGKKTKFISFSLGFGVFLAQVLKFVSIGKVDYIEKVQRMGEDRSFPHDDATRDFGYNPISFKEGIGIEIKQYVERKMK